METELHVLKLALIALACGGIVGWERERAGKAAGLRTHMLVCLASMLFVKLGEILALRSQDILDPGALRSDPVRILEAIATGIAFIGAGTIFRDRGQNWARGLTTAASLLCVAPIGVAVALERHLLAFGSSGIVFVVLFALALLEEKLAAKRPNESRTRHDAPLRRRNRRRGRQDSRPGQPGGDRVH